jgi:dienelactone hydrolase
MYSPGAVYLLSSASCRIVNNLADNQIRNKPRGRAMAGNSGRLIFRSVTAAILAAGMASAAFSQAAGPGPGAPGAGANQADMQRRQEEQNSRPDNIGTGKFAAMKEEVASLPAHVIYRPANLGAMGSMKLGVVAWGNGGCSADAASSRFHLLEIASHGYLVIAYGRILSGPGAPPRAPRQAGAGGPGAAGPGAAGPGAGAPGARGPAPAPATTASQLTQAIDWAMKENARKDSPYYGRIDANQIAAAGFSCGGIQAMGVADDPRLDTIVMQNTGLIVNDTTTMGGMSMEKSQLQKAHTPIFYVLGGPSDIAYTNGMDDFQKINHVPVAVANLGNVGHGGSYAEENGGRAAQAVVKWLDWTLRGNAEAGKWFVGASCGLCTDSEWKFESKNLDKVRAVKK